MCALIGWGVHADPAVFAYDFTPVSTDITGVGVSLNIFSIAPCVVVVDAVGVKVFLGFQAVGYLRVLGFGNASATYHAA